MDPWTLAYLAGHRDMNITKRYVHPQEQTIRAAMDRARESKVAYFRAYRPHTRAGENSAARRSD